jgi:hypothetical protein
MKTVYFSNFIDEGNIVMKPKAFDSSKKTHTVFSITKKTNKLLNKRLIRNLFGYIATNI